MEWRAPSSCSSTHSSPCGFNNFAKPDMSTRSDARNCVDFISHRKNELLLPYELQLLPSFVCEATYSFAKLFIHWVYFCERSRAKRGELAERRLTSRSERAPVPVYGKTKQLNISKTKNFWSMVPLQKMFVITSWTHFRVDTARHDHDAFWQLISPKLLNV